MKRKGIRKVCSRGHVFFKSSDCPVCPRCWSGYYRKKQESDFPETLSAPALRALKNAKIKKLADLRKYTEREIAGLHGMGPKGMRMLRTAMKVKRLQFTRDPK